jgi:hypothetical protein
MNKITRFFSLALLALSAALVPAPQTAAQGCIVLSNGSLLSTGAGILCSGNPLPPAPQAIWPGVVSSTAAEVGAWPPNVATPTPPYTYNLYRNGTQLATGIVPTPPDTGAQPQIFYLDQSLTYSTNYTYYYTAVLGGVESAPSPSWSFTTLAGTTTATTAPTAPTDPSSWVVAYSLPTGGTTWKATNTTTNSQSCTPSGGVATGCGLQYALSAANIAGGDVIVATAGATYSGNFTMPAFTGASGWTYLVSSQDPGYNGSGTLPAYTTNSTPLDYSPAPITGTLAASAVSATLTTPWAGRSGNYPTLFKPTTAGAVPDTRSVIYTNGLTTVSWSVGLVNAASATIYPCVLSGVTPFDIPSMATISFPYGNQGDGLIIPPAATKVRIVGINITPTPSITTQMFYAVYAGNIASAGNTPTPCASIYFDRDLIGPDTATYGSGMSFVTHGIGSGCNNLFVHQSYIRGITNDSGSGGAAGGDANGIFTFGGGPIAVEQTYLEGQSEGMMLGGTYIAQANQSHDVVYRYNYNTKPTQWLANELGESPKNHFELKMGQRVAAYGNLHQGNWSGVASEGQHGRSFVIGARDQTASVGSGYTVSGITKASSAVVTVSTVQGTNPFSTVSGSNSIIVSAITTGMTQINNIQGTVTATGGSSGAWTATTNINSSAFTAWSAGGVAYNTTMTTQNPWIYVSDFSAHDNKIYGVNSCAYFFSADHSAEGWTGRVNFSNNICQIQPGVPVSGTVDQGYGIWTDGIVPDATIDHNTFIIDTAHLQNSGLYTASIYDDSAGPNTLYTDRWTITNNIMDGTAAVSGTSEAGASTNTALAAYFKNTTWNKNLTVLDNSAAPTGTFSHVAYGSIGFWGFNANSYQPQPANQWNVGAGSYSAASTTGGALGAAFEQDGYPLLAMTSYGGTETETTATAGVTWTQMASRRHYSLTSWYPTWNDSSGGTAATVTASVKSANVMAAPARVLNYFIATTVPAGSTGSGSVYYSFYEYLLGAKWLLYNAAGSTGSVVTNGGEPVVNVTTYAPTYSSQTFTQYYAPWLLGWNFNGVGQTANPLMDGLFFDNYEHGAVATGYWNLTASSAPGEPDPNQWVRTGEAGIVSALRSAAPSTYIQGGNVAAAVGPGITLTGLTNTLDVPYLESMSGQSYSQETVSWARVLSVVQQAQTMWTGLPNSGCIWHADSMSGTTGQDYASTLRSDPNWQAVRYTIGASMVLGCYYAVTANSTSTGYNSAAQFNLDVMNEGAGLTSTQGYEYLGQPLTTAQGAIQTAAWQTISGQQIWRRDFANGIVLVRIPTNAPVTTANTTSVTVTATMLGNKTYHLYTSSQDSTYSGASETSWTFPRDRDSIVLLNSATVY